MVAAIVAGIELILHKDGLFYWRGLDNRLYIVDDAWQNVYQQTLLTEAGTLRNPLN